jgi:hypothetical protein
MAALATVEAPEFGPASGGLLSVANIVEGEPRIGMGITYDNTGLCGVAHALPAGCWVAGPSDQNKAFDGLGANVEAVSFGIYKGVECWLSGDDNFEATAVKGLGLGESFAVASALRSTLLDVSPTVILAGSTNDPALALAKAEQWAGENYSGQAVVHVTRYGATILANLGLLVRNLDGSLETWLGSKVSADAGYLAGESTSFTIWITGQVNIWRTPVIVNNAPNTTLNKGRGLAERLYAATVDCIHGKVVAAASTLTTP